jgi:hypothetical protein
LAVVHLYLLLLFIVSFPGSYSTRTRCIIIRKSCSSQDVSDSESESSNGKVEPCRVVTFEPQVRPERRVSKRGGLLGRIMRSPEIEEISSENGATLKKKSLSYFLWRHQDFFTNHCALFEPSCFYLIFILLPSTSFIIIIDMAMTSRGSRLVTKIPFLFTR